MQNQKNLFNRQSYRQIGRKINRYEWYKRRRFKSAVGNSFSGALVSNASSSTIVSTNTYTSGDLVIVSARWTDAGNSITASISDGTNTYTAIAKVNANSQSQQSWYHVNVASGSTTVTVTLSSATANSMRVDGWSGATNWVLTDHKEGSSGAGTGPLSSGNLTTNANNALLAGYLHTVGSTSAPTASGYTALNDAAGRTHAMDNLSNTAGTNSFSVSWSTSSTGNWAVLLAFEAPSGSGWGALLSDKRNRLVY